MIDQLDQDSVGIAEVERSSTVAMGFGSLVKRNATLANPVSPNIHILRSPDNETDVIEALNRITAFGNGRFMQREIVLACTRQICVLLVRHPLEGHSKEILVKRHGSLYVTYVQGNVPDTQKAKVH